MALTSQWQSYCSLLGHQHLSLKRKSRATPALPPTTPTYFLTTNGLVLSGGLAVMLHRLFPANLTGQPHRDLCTRNLHRNDATARKAVHDYWQRQRAQCTRF
eukprot:6471521-Amphidinium_carterae.3